MRIHLRAGERFFINGAVLQVTQKTTLNLLNDARFLLENYVMQPEEAVTPMKQLYFFVQTALIDPQAEDASLKSAKSHIARMRLATSNIDLHGGLDEVEKKLENESFFDALKVLKKLFKVELTLLPSENAEDDEPVLEPHSKVA